uniref:Cell 5A endo-1,4-betaglucanase n=1 Tax=Phytophthora ramorum TaxID=164328 RepID=Q0PMZ8_PHYRM|nr:cell 5A endo-1,4-betaglucanase [Phytophthora ramorum]ABG80555.1 cell 5A endo-1,4-betaglucanase [Phytophthora ramorum]
MAIDQRDTRAAADSPVSASEMLDSPTQHYSAMLSRGDSHDIPDQDFIPRTPAREIFRQPSDAFPQTISDRGGYSYSARPTELHAESPRVTFSFSGGDGSGSGSGVGMVAAAPVALARPSMMERNIEAVREPTGAGFVAKTQHYKARYRRWPGVVLLLAIVIGGAVGITFAALHTKTASTARQEAYAKRKASASSITGGASGSGSDLVSDDGAVGNPKSYPDMGCELPDYQSKDGHIYAVASNGTEVAVDMKGINWFGMETGTAIPLGLWDNSENGTTAYQIASFLEKNKFNAVRLPLCINWILTNKTPESTLINTAENRAISIKNYRSLLKSLIKALAYRQIGVLISLHTLTSTDNGGLWYSDNITQSDYLDAVDTLTGDLCSNTYWNVIGLDLKNEPYEGTWGDGEDTDWREGAQTIGNRMLKGCSNWMGFVEGIYASHTLTIDDTDYSFYDWYGSGLQKANEYPVEFTTDNKVVYAPHYYTPAVYPQSYLYGGGTSGDNGELTDYVELSNSSLKTRISSTMDEMFGFIADNQSAAMLLGEFGGLYSSDLHPELTTQRCTDFSIDIMLENGWAGGFVWSLNPESAYQYNPADTYGTFTEGVLEDDWLTANSGFLEGLVAMNDLENLRMMPCFETEESDSGSSGSD